MQANPSAIPARLGSPRDWRVASKLVVATACVMLVLTIIISVAVVRQNRTTLEGQLASEVTSAAKFLKFQADQKGTANLRDGKLQFGLTGATSDFSLVDATKDLTGAEATVFQLRDGEFVRVATTLKQADGSRAVETVLQGPAATALKAGRDYVGVNPVLGQDYIASYILLLDPAGKPVGALFAGKSSAPIAAQATRTTYTIAAISLVLFTLSLALLYGLMSRLVTRPLRTLELAARRITEGDYAVRVPVSGRDELGQVSVAVNTMVDQITTAGQEQAAQNAALQRQIVQLLEEVSTVAEGDLTAEAEVTDNTLGAVADSFNYMIGELRQIIGRVNAATQQVGASADEILATTDVLHRSATQQAARIADTSTAVEEMAVSIQQVSENAAISAQVAREARDAADDGTQAMSATATGMARIREQVQETGRKIERLSASSREIGTIVALIKDVADQTSVLALNAAIRAAAAGEHGKGFAVVAEEVRRLAERTTTASAQIEALVKGIQAETDEAMVAMAEGTREVESGAALADGAGRALARIDATAEQLAALIEAISLAAEQQARASAGIARAMGEISGLTAGTTAGTQQAAASVASLAALADGLRDSVTAFRLDTNEPVATSPSAAPPSATPARGNAVASYAGVAD